MLPFRLKPPSYGGKLKKEKLEQASLLDRNHPLRDGGPLQRAIYDDLIAQYPKFVAALHQDFVEDARDTRGYSFKIFKKVFAQAGIALLHTQLTPPRCDAAAYSQLIYAVCFDLLRHVFKSNEDTFSFGAFAVFLLYSLYETNPHPTKLSSEMESLPMNLQDRDNPRLIYRRCYRERIRIDLQHYHYLLELRDTCLEKVSRFQAELGNVEQHEENTSIITCALAKDTAEVISRLMPSFDYCAYTGPCGLEALAGHGDYPTPPTAATKKWWKANRQKLSLRETEPSAPDAQCDNSYEIPTALQEQVEQYINQRKNLRVPGKHSGRAREGVIHLFSQKKTALEALAFFSRTAQPETKRIKLRHGFVEIPVDASTHPTRNTDVDHDNEPSLQESPSHDHAEKAPPDFHLVLPSGLSTILEESLRDAFETLGQRKVMLPPATVTANQEEVSTLAKSLSIATSVTGTGRNALQALLQQAIPRSMNEGGFSNFLESQDNAADDTERVPTNDVVSDISSDEGEMTVAGSTVGRSALQDLLSYATGTAAREKGKRGKKPAAKRAPRKKPAAKPKPKPKKGTRPRQNAVKENEEKSESDSIKSGYSHSSHDDSISSNDSDDDNEGRSALNTLIARAYATGTAAREKDKRGKKPAANRALRKKPSAKPKKGTRPRQNAVKENEEKSESDSIKSGYSHSSHDDSISSSHDSDDDNEGRSALNALIARAYATGTAARERGKKGKKPAAKRAPRKKPAAKAKPKPKKGTRPRQNAVNENEEKSESDSVKSGYSHSSPDDSISSSHDSDDDNEGRSALNALIARACV